MKSVRFSYVWWHYTDDGEEINCFIFNNKANKILDLINNKVYDIDPNNIFKSIKNIYGNKGRLDNTETILSYYVYKDGIRGYQNTQIFGDSLKYVDKEYLQNFTEKLREKIKAKQEDIVNSIKIHSELEF